MTPPRRGENIMSTKLPSKTVTTTKTTTTTSTTPKRKKRTPPGPINLAIAAPPAQPSPVPPAGANLTGKAPRGVALVGLLVGMVPAVGTELRANAQAFTQEFGAKIPPVDLANALDTAALWRQARTGAEQWRTYVVRGDSAAWGPVLGALTALRKLWVTAVELDPQVPSRFPQLATMMEAKVSPGVRAARSRAAAAKKAETTATTESPSPTTTAENPPPTGATPAQK
jgi:hypothetical protein